MSNIQKDDRPGRFSVKPEVVDGVLVVTVQGAIDHAVKDLLSQALLSEDGTVPPPRIVADLSGVTFMDSSDLNIFVNACPPTREQRSGTAAHRRRPGVRRASVASGRYRRDHAIPPSSRP
ncbi:STAS domain-containing protein [Streptomyces mirabilis]|uniref:STAS domain-containing protein n=1 Tax=Streptomyces mirabilis TaxID=68239 RepID=UPI0033B00C39